MKLTILLAVEPGDLHLPPRTRAGTHIIQNSMRQINVIQQKGTTSWIFASSFILHSICKDIEANPVPGDSDTDKERIFLWDNLPGSSQQLLKIAFRPDHKPTKFQAALLCPLYQPKYGPIEFSTFI